MTGRRLHGWLRRALGAALVTSTPAWAAPIARVEFGIGSEAYAIPGRVDQFFRPVSPALQVGAAAVIGHQHARGVFGGEVGAWVHPGYRNGLWMGGTAGCEGWLSERFALEGRLAVGFWLDGWSGEAWSASDGRFVEQRQGGLPYAVVMPGLAAHVVIVPNSGLFLRYEQGPMFPLHGFPGFLTGGFVWRSR